MQGEDMAVINLPYGNSSFDSDMLLEYIINSGRGYIIQGHTACSLKDHPKKHSLDYWLRENYTKNKDTMQAVKEVIDQLVNTGDFETGSFLCPKSGRRCKGIKVK